MESKTVSDIMSTRPYLIYIKRYFLGCHQHRFSGLKKRINGNDSWKAGSMVSASGVVGETKYKIATCCWPAPLKSVSSRLTSYSSGFRKLGFACCGTESSFAGSLISNVFGLNRLPTSKSDIKVLNDKYWMTMKGYRPIREVKM